MNLREWLEYQKFCPLCEAPLTTYLHSGRRQSIRWEEDHMIVIFPFQGMNKMRTVDYNVGYSFHLTQNHFNIEFYTKDNLRLEKEIPLHLMDKFKLLDKNLKSYEFYRQCNSCSRYHYTSSKFSLNYKECSLQFDYDFCVSTEYFGLIQNLEKESKWPFRIYRLLNCYLPDREGSFLVYWNDLIPDGTYADRTFPSNATSLDLPLIYFVSPEETLSRIQKLLVFS